MRRAVAFALLVVVASLSVAATQAILPIPYGIVPTLDGALAEGEWDDAAFLRLENDISLYLKHAEGSLYLGVRGQPLAIVTPCFLMGNRIRVLHVSGSLGTLAYELHNGVWKRSQPAVWDCFHDVLDNAAVGCIEGHRTAQGWTAANGQLGAPAEYEMEVLVSADPLQMLFLYMLSLPERVLTSWPIDVGAMPEYMDLARSALASESMAFETDQWATLALAQPEAGEIDPLDAPAAAPTLEETPATGSVGETAALRFLGEGSPPLGAAVFRPDVLPLHATAGTFSPQMSEFFCNVPGAGEGRIYGLGLSDGVWAPVASPAEFGIEPHIAPRGDRLFFTRTVAGIGTGFVSFYEDGRWSEPQPLPPCINGTTYFPMYITSTLDGSLYWTEISYGAFLARTPLVDGVYGRRQRVLVDLNTTGACAHPFIAPDESYLLFDAELDGQSDLYVTFLLESGEWTPAQLVMEISDASAAEMMPSVSPDGAALFFARDMQMHWIDASILERYRP